MQFVIARFSKWALLLAACLLLPGMAMARQGSDKRALIVGINAYPKLGVEPLAGAEEDAISMTEFADTVAGYRKPLCLLGKQATLDAVRDWMETVLDDTSAKHVLVYFSGRGSVAKNTDKESRYPLVPSLVFVDSNKDDSKHDLALSELEAFASKVSKQHRTITIILDTCYMKIPTISKDFESAQWKSEPKCFARGTTDATLVRPVVWSGDGTCLCATATNGGAYEVTNSLDKWQGVFTQTLLEWAEPAMVAQQKPSARYVIDQVGFALNPLVGKSYLTGERVVGYPAEGPRLDDVFLTDQVSTDRVSDRMKQIAQASLKSRTQFRIALDSDNEHIPQINAIAQKIRADLPQVHVVAKNQVPDRVIEIGLDRVHPDNRHDGDLHLQAGEAAEDNDLNDFDSTKDWAAFRDRLLKSWYGLALFRSAETRKSTSNWVARPDREIYDKTQEVKLNITSTQAGALLVLYRDESDGFVDNWFPSIDNWEMNIVRTGEYSTDSFVGFDDTSVETRTELACYYIAPSLFKPDLQKLDQKTQKAQFNAQMVAILKQLWDAVSTGKPGWASSFSHYYYKKS